MSVFHSRRLPMHLDTDALAEPDFHPTCIDLAQSNPTRCGFHYPELPDAVWQPFGAPYAPLAMGPKASLEALAQTQTAWGRSTTADQLMLTSSTSEALSYLFKVALNPGDTVAAAVPGYPLVPHLAELEGLHTAAFYSRQNEAGDWHLDLASVQACLEKGARALVLVSPNNPTGSVLTAQELGALATLCNRHGALAIFDEVFAPYHRHAPHIRLLDLQAFERAVSLGGLSKAGLMPQLKLSWIDVHGSQAFRAATLAGLEWVGDAYLSLGRAAGLLPYLLPTLPAMQQQAYGRMTHNQAHLAQMLATSQVATLDRATAGWYAVVRPHAHLPGVRLAQKSQQHVAEALLAHAHVNLHPGFLYDLSGEHVLVAGLLGPTADQDAGWQRVCRYLAG
jgi:alanine-synthesizing transaminase